MRLKILSLNNQDPYIELNLELQFNASALKVEKCQHLVTEEGVLSKVEVEKEQYYIASSTK
jgi:hypothetical protein